MTDAPNRGEIEDDLRAASALPEADPSFVREVMAKADAPERKRATGYWLWPSLAAVAAAILVFVLIPGGSKGPGSEFVARGGETGAEALMGYEFYVHGSRGAQGVRGEAGMQLEPGVSLSFDVINHSGRSLNLMLFGVDAAGDVHWFYPAYLDAAAPPSSVSLAGAQRKVAFREAVEPEDLAPGSFTLVGWFTNKSYDVAQVEALIEAGGVDALALEPGHFGMQRVGLEVVR